MKSLTADQASLGFIGMGAMGSRMAKRLRDHGYQVAVYDRSPSRAKALLPYGISVPESLAELAAKSDVILSCLPNDKAVQSVYAAREGVLTSARPGTVLLEMSTISPQASRDLHALALEEGLHMLDVAISGSTPAVENGAVTLLAGGEADVFEAAKPIFQTLAAHYVLLGPSGSGTSMKLVVNTVLGIGMQAIAEAVALGETAGLERKRLLEVLSQTAVVAPAYVGKLTRAENNEYAPQFAASMMNKDFGLILDMAHSSNLPLPATVAAFHVNSSALKESPSADFSYVIRHMEEIAELSSAKSIPIAALGFADRKAM